tara:strand:+ start:228 stop:491 length:264 start_codon:yes stop_codon:yes gene_type:complete
MKTSLRLLPKSKRGKPGICWSCDSLTEVHYRDYSVDGDLCLDCYDTAHEVEQLLTNNKYMELLKGEGGIKIGIRHPNPNEISDEDNH